MPLVFQEITALNAIEISLTTRMLELIKVLRTDEVVYQRIYANTNNCRRLTDQDLGRTRILLDSLYNVGIVDREILYLLKFQAVRFACKLSYWKESKTQVNIDSQIRNSESWIAWFRAKSTTSDLRYISPDARAIQSHQLDNTGPSYG